MKNLYLLFCALFLVIEAFPQATFNTGAIEVDVNVYGRIRLYSADGTRHLQRGSILAGTSSSAVFDYQNDAEELETTTLVADPELSDFEIYGAFDNSYSGDPPDVIVRLNAYGWTGGEYTIVKFNIENTGSSSLDFTIGLDLIPELHGVYGYDTVTFITDQGVIRFHRGTGVNMGVKLLSHDLTSLFSFEWYDGYTVDADYWTWLTYGMLQPQYASNTADGPVTITGQDAISLGAGESVDVFYAMALGANESAMVDNIGLAVEQYQAWITGVDPNAYGLNAMMLHGSYPNPFNGNTDIHYFLAETGHTCLDIYNAQGSRIASLVNDQQPAGEHTVNWNTLDLPDGMYFCTLVQNGQQQSLKLIKGR